MNFPVHAYQESSKEVKHCEHCNELTPQICETCGSRCQVCGNQNEYSIEHMMAGVDDTWLADFWFRKFMELKKDISSTPFPSLIFTKNPQSD